MPHLLEIIVQPIGSRGRYEAFHKGRLLAISRTPFLSAARKLQKEGVPDATPIAMRHASSCFIALTSTVGAAAGLTVNERRPAFRPLPERAGPVIEGSCMTEYLTPTGAPNGS